MKSYRLFLLTAVLLFSSLSLSAQEFLWGVDFDYRFDNREYSDLKVAESETLFGARVVPQVGLGWGNGNAIMVGVDVQADFGHRPFYTDPGVVVYFSWNSPKYGVYAGVFPRNKMIGEYSNAFFSDSVRFYDSNLDGLLLQLKGKRGYMEWGCDWNSMYSADRREKFMLFSAARINQGIGYAGYNLNMYHHAGSYTEKGVVDNVLIFPHLGIDLSNRYGFRRFYVQAGWLQAFQNDRTFIGEYVTPGGAQIDLRVERWGFGIFNSLYLGQNLMPYYKSTVPGQLDYEYGLYYGDPYFRTTSGIYNRVELYWELKTKFNVNARVASVHHYDGRNWGWQQVVALQVILNKDLFRKKN